MFPAAVRPSLPGTTSKVTASPSFNSSNVTPFKASLWKKTSFDPSSGAINPNALSSTFFLIFPVMFVVFACLILKRNPTSVSYLNYYPLYTNLGKNARSHSSQPEQLTHPPPVVLVMGDNWQ